MRPFSCDLFAGRLPELEQTRKPQRAPPSKTMMATEMSMAIISSISNICSNITRSCAI